MSAPPAVPTSPPPSPPPNSMLRRAWNSRVGGLPGTFWWLWSGSLVNRAGGFVQPFLVLYLTGPRDFDIAGAGVVLAAYGAGSVMSQPLGGALADRIGRRATLAAGLFSTAALLIVLGVARGFTPVLVAAIALGVVSQLFRPASTAMIADIIAPADRARAYALQYWAVNLGFSIAAVTAGVLASHGYWLLFAVDAGSCALFAALVLWRVPETRPAGPHPPGSAADGGRPPRFAGLRIVVRDRVLLALVALILVYAVLYNQVYTVLPLHVVDVGLGTSAYGVAIAVNGIGVVVLQPLLLPVFTRLSRRVLLPVSMLLVGGGIALTGLAHQFVLLVLSVIVWTIGEIGFSGSTPAVVAAIAPAALRGRYAGAVGLAWGGSALLGPLMGTSLYSSRPEIEWLVCLILGVLAAAGYLLLDRAVQRRVGEIRQVDEGVAPAVTR